MDRQAIRTFLMADHTFVTPPDLMTSLTHVKKRRQQLQALDVKAELQVVFARWNIK